MDRIISILLGGAIAYATVIAVLVGVHLWEVRKRTALAKQIAIARRRSEGMRWCEPKYRA